MLVLAVGFAAVVLTAVVWRHGAGPLGSGDAGARPLSPGTDTIASTDTTARGDRSGAATALQPGLVRALDAARVESRRPIPINSGFRTAARQQELLDEATAKYGSRSVALRWVFAPERSMHVQGLAIDVGSGPDAEWLSDHGAAFGLCRTLSWEWWHFEWRPGWEDARRCPTPARSPADAPDVEDGSANKPDRGR